MSRSSDEVIRLSSWERERNSLHETDEALHRSLVRLTVETEKIYSTTAQLSEATLGLDRTMDRLTERVGEISAQVAELRRELKDPRIGDKFIQAAITVLWGSAGVLIAHYFGIFK